MNSKQVNRESEMRREPRITMNKRGSVSAAAMSWRPCLIQDLSLHGMLVMCTRPHAVNEVLTVACEISPKQILKCKVKVQHASDMCHGGPILEIDDADKKTYARYIEELCALKSYEGRQRQRR